MVIKYLTVRLSVYLHFTEVKNPFLVVVGARYFYSIPPHKILCICLTSDAPNVLSGVSNTTAQELGGMVFSRLNK